MCAHATPDTASSSPFAATRRSLLSRLTNPLKSRTRNLTDFYIRPDEAHRQYSPGDVVKGAVILTVGKPIRITHLTVCLHGFVRVFKNPNGVKEPLPIEADLTVSSSPKKSQYIGNGHASLFRDEQTLCGEGRLEPGVYEFNFELEFPTRGLPTSIDFERGTISYMITSTITRPTSIAATSSCDQKISLVETVDIGPMKPPRPRTISLEPISRRSRMRKTVKTKEGSPVDAKDTDSGSPKLPGSSLPDESASQRGSVDHNTDPQTPTQSDVHSITSAATSAESTTSGSTSFRLGPVLSSTRSTRDTQLGRKSSLPDKTITATIELLKSGCLAGDNLPLKISIKHTKAIKSMHGIIITLYRQGRIDSAPPSSLFTDIKGKGVERLKHEEYYPKSKTGLGGLSLSSAGSSNLFRKDLAQTFAPLLVDPTTLTAVVTASVRVPEDVFPTIKGVPGEMISFKYHLEVVVDLGGKLAGQQRHLPRVGAITLPSNYGTSGTSVNANMLAAWGGSIVNTDHIRREKSVVACLFEVVIGSTDSARRRGRGNSTARRQMNGWPEEPTTPLSTDDPIYGEASIPGPEHDGAGQQQYDQTFEGHHPGHYGTEGYGYEDYDWYSDEYPGTYAQMPVPPPEVHDEGLTEKERARLAEERLLPSQPPEDTQDPSSSSTAVPPLAPSAPPNEREDDLYTTGDATPHAVPEHFQSLNEAAYAEPHAPSAPAFEDLAPGATLNPAEDKQELERQRLLAETSAPSELIHDEDGNAGEGSSGTQQEPSAPILGEEDYGGHHAHPSMAGPSSMGETLPRYER
ncbi:pH-response regulator palF RIM8 [Hyphodiscus hymeniophilus]|uniref:PH-response regulator palF RIM8 n=1 Tax=Hyphodiscus hymeniophilus TaxID=353542 RepID=A0A9P6VMV9_9HELO|nr:pH-response regulator palF RIM8 [Hyphodiscus hymeniophilus]